MNHLDAVVAKNSDLRVRAKDGDVGRIALSSGAIRNVVKGPEIRAGLERSLAHRWRAVFAYSCYAGLRPDNRHGMTLSGITRSSESVNFCLLHRCTRGGAYNDAPSGVSMIPTRRAALIGNCLQSPRHRTSSRAIT